MEVADGAPADGEDDGVDVDWDSLPWFGSSEPGGTARDDDHEHLFTF